VSRLTTAALALILATGLAFADADPDRFGMAVESAGRAEDGSVVVVTTGARFVARGAEIACFQRIPAERRVATVVCHAVRLGRAAPSISDDRYLCRIGPHNAPHLEITADSVLRVAPLRPSDVAVRLQFEPEWFETEERNLFAADFRGGCGAYQVPTRRGWEPFEIEPGRGARFSLPAGDSLLLSVFPPRRYDWVQHTSEQIVHDFPPRSEPGAATRPFPTDGQLRDWRALGNVLVLHLEMWDSFCTPDKRPVDAERFDHVLELAHELGWRVLIYSSPYFYRTRAGLPRNLSEPEEYIEQLDRLLTDYPVGGIYWDGTYDDVEKAWRVARLARQRLGDRRLYVHCTRKPFHDSLVACPFVDTWADYLLRGEGRSRDFVDANFIRFLVSGYNVSNAVGTLCWDGCRLTEGVIGECLGANALIPAWPGGQRGRLNRAYFFTGDERQLFEGQYLPAARAIGGPGDYEPLERQNRALRAQVRHERETRHEQNLAELEAYLAQRRAEMGPTEDLAAFRPCTASATTHTRVQPGPHGVGYVPAYATDGDPRTYWGADYAPQWLRVDLGEERTIGRVRVVNYADGERFYHYRVECSSDDESWLTVAEKMNDGPATWDGDEHLFEPTPARYVRVWVLHNSANIGLHVGELEVYAPGD